MAAMSKPRITLDKRLIEAARRYKNAVQRAGGKISLADAMVEVDRAHQRTGKRLPGGKP